MIQHCTPECKRTYLHPIVNRVLMFYLNERYLIKHKTVKTRETIVVPEDLFSYRFYKLSL